MRRFVPSLISLVLLGACQVSSPDALERTGGKITVDLSAHLTQTRSSLSDNGAVSSFFFNTDDHVGLFADDFLPNCDFVCIDGGIGKFRGQIALTPEQASYRSSASYYLYYPYTNSAGNDPSSLSAVLPSKQNAPFDGNADFIVANPIVAEYDISHFAHLNFTFANHLFAIVKLSVSNSNDAWADEEIKDIGLKSSVTPLGGAFTFNATNPEAPAVFSTNDEDLNYRVCVSYDDTDYPRLGTGETHTVYAIVNPAEYAAGTLKLVVSTTHYRFTLPTTKDISLSNTQVTVFPQVDLTNENIIVSTEDLLSFSISDGGTPPYYSAEIRDTLVSVHVPNLTDLSSMTIHFVHNGASLSIDGVEQEDGVSVCDFNDFTAPTHLVVTGADGETKQYTVRVFDLPVVIIDTPNPITSKTIWTEGCSVSIIEDDGNVVVYGNEVEVKGRGNVSWGMPKKPYTFKLSKKQSVLGMPKDKRWNLLANYLDRTGVRNDISLELARRAEGLDWTSHGQFVEVILNGVFMGTYYLCEHNKIAEDRINITEMATTDTSEEAITGGYLIEYDSYKESPFFITERGEFPVTVKSPDDPGFEFAWAWIEGHINELEGILMDDDALLAHRYLKYIDIDSFVDWYFVFEISGNIEPAGTPNSCYMYKDRSGKLHAGPVWDMDVFTYRYNSGYTGLLLRNAIYYKYLFKDPMFRAKIRERWPMLLANLADMPEYIDLQMRKISRAIYRDKAMWPLKVTYETSVNGDNFIPISEANERIKNYYNARIPELTSIINSAVLRFDYDNRDTGNEDFGDQTNPDFGFGF